MGAKLENATYLTTHCYNLILVIFSFSYLIVRKWCTNEMTHPKVILLSFGRYYCGCPITTGCGQGKMSQIAAWLLLGHIVVTDAQAALDGEGINRVQGACRILFSCGGA